MVGEIPPPSNGSRAGDSVNSECVPKVKGMMISAEEVRALKVLGRGATGTVFLVARKSPCDGDPLALKVMSKSVLSKNNDALKRTRTEGDILAALHHPFLPSLLGHLQTESIVAWAVEYCPGGDLNHLRQAQPERTFSETAIRFYAAEVVLALEHLHGLGIVYRDLKPENILIQASGHIMLTDFDLSTRLPPRQPNHVVATTTGDDGHRRDGDDEGRVVKARSRSRSRWVDRMLRRREAAVEKVERVSPERAKSNSFVGTKEYMAPEMVKGEGHDFGVDWWALGVLLYEMLYGRTPFKGSDKKETFRRIAWQPPVFLGPNTALHDVIRGLLQKDPRRRLGSLGGALDVKSHPFFRDLHWDSIHLLSRPPFLPCHDIQSSANVYFLDMESYVHDSSNAAKDASPRRHWADEVSTPDPTDAFGLF